jgi:hypothetical protein
VQSYFGYDIGLAWWCVLIVLAYTAFFRTGAVVMLRYVSYQRRWKAMCDVLLPGRRI